MIGTNCILTVQNFTPSYIMKQAYVVILFFFSADENAARNFRPQSREMSLEEEKAAVLAEMRNVSKSSDD